MWRTDNGDLDMSNDGREHDCRGGMVAEQRASWHTTAASRATARHLGWRL